MDHHSNAGPVDSYTQRVSRGEHLLVTRNQLIQQPPFVLVVAHLAEIRRPTQHLCQLFRLGDATTIHDNLPRQRVLLAFLVHQRHHRVVRVVAVKSPDAILNIRSGGSTTNYHHLLQIDACDAKKSIFVSGFQRRGQIHQLGFMLAQLDQRQHLGPPIVDEF